MGNDERIRLLERAADEGVPGADEELRRLKGQPAEADSPEVRFAAAVSSVVDAAAAGGRMPRKPLFMARLGHEARSAASEWSNLLTNLPDRHLAMAWVRHGRRNTTSGRSTINTSRWTWFPYDPTAAASGMFHVAFAFSRGRAAVGVTRNPREWEGMIRSVNVGHLDGHLEEWPRVPGLARAESWAFLAWANAC